MLNAVIDAPYIVLSTGKVTPALILGILYFGILALFWYYGRKTHTLAFRTINFKECKKGKQNQILFSIFVYVLSVFVCTTLPSFLEEENFIGNFSKIYLQYESLIILCLFAFLCSSFLNVKNRERQIIASNDIFKYLILISIGTGIFSAQIDLSLWQNKLIIVLAGIFYFLLTIIEIKAIEVEKSSRGTHNWISYSPAKGFEELFPYHKIQAEQIADIIATSSSDPFSICISGKWGTGKTSVINGAIELLNQKSADSYATIRINALEIDNKESMFRYIMMQIKHCLKEKGVYVGVNSEYKEFVASSMGAVTAGAIGDLLQKRLFAAEEDYRERKESLGEIIERAFSDGKLVVIVDDIERCDEAVAKEYIFLIKEIATMKNCVSVFVTDYNLLNQLFKIEDSSSYPDEYAPNERFLDKFFNYRIDLFDEEPENILDFYDRSFSVNDKDFWSIYELVGMSPATWYSSVMRGLNDEIDALEKKAEHMYLNKANAELNNGKINELKECRALLVERMQIPRTIVTLYNSFKKNAYYCYQSMFTECEDSEHENIRKYIKTRNVGQVLLFLSFVNACLPNEMHQLTKKGSAYIHSTWEEIVKKQTTERQLLLNIANGMLFDQYTKNKEPNGYLKQEIYRFIDAFLTPSFALIQLCRPFTTQEAEWISAIDNQDNTVIEAHWNEMMVMVLQKNLFNNPYEINQWRNKYFNILMGFAETQVALKKWETDVVFSLFEYKARADVYFATGTGLMCSFWKCIYNSKVFKVPSQKCYEEILTFSNHYAYKRVETIYELAHYLLDNDDYSKVKHLRERLLDSTKPLAKNISLFLTQLAQHIPNISLPDGGWRNEYDSLSNHIKENLEDVGLLEYSDVKDDVEQMMDAANELYCLERFLKWCKTGALAKPAFLLNNTVPSNLEEALVYFEGAFDNAAVYRNRDTITEFANFFIMLRDSAELELTADEIKRLHKLVTVFVDKTGYSSLLYRKTLIDLSKKIKTTSKK